MLFLIAKGAFVGMRETERSGFIHVIIVVTLCWSDFIDVDSLNTHSHTKLDLGTPGEGTFGQFLLLMLLQVSTLNIHMCRTPGCAHSHPSVQMAGCPCRD